MVPTRNQDVLQQLADIDAEKNNIKERMAEAKEAREKKSAEERKAKQKSFDEKYRMYLIQQERKARTEYGNRRMVIDDFDESRIRMLPFRVLVKELAPKREEGGIALPEMQERHPRNVVLCVGDGIDEIAVGDIVVADAYSGVEIARGADRFRILLDSDILFKVED